MVNTKDLETTVALTLATAYIKGETPQSTMIVSDRPEAGKSVLVNQFSKVDGIVVLNDSTWQGLIQRYKTELVEGKIKHIIMPEFLAPISRNQTTVGSFLANIQQLIEDGYQQSHTGFLHVDLKEPVVVGVIACLPKPAFYLNRTRWMQGGLLSRFLVVSYDYNSNTIDAIFESIMERQYLEATGITVNFKEVVDVKLPHSIASQCKALALDTTERSRNSKGLYGFRQLESVQRLVMANVVLDKAQGADREPTATQADFDKVEAISYLFNEQFNELRGE